MRNILAITALMVGLAGTGLAIDQDNSAVRAATTQQASRDTDSNSATSEQAAAPATTDCKTDQQSTTTDNDPARTARTPRLLKTRSNTAADCALFGGEKKGLTFAVSPFCKK